MKHLNISKGSMKSKLIIIGIVLIVAFGLLLGYLSADLFTNLNDRVKQTDNNNEVLEISETSVGQTILNEDAVIIYNRVYSKCNDLVTEQKVVDSQYIGKNEKELEELFVGWDIVTFNSDKVIVEKSIDSYSPHYYKIGIYNQGDGENMVAVFTFDIDGQEIVDTITGTPTNLLHDNDIQKLKEGIYTKDTEELYNMLQNFDE
ncbi:MAG: hypothetical protein ACOWWR_06535 [Eubacteriales bacterium]